MTAEFDLPELPAGQMHFAIKTHDGKTHLQVMPTPKELPTEGGSYSTELPGYGKVILTIVKVTDKLIACREVSAEPGPPSRIPTNAAEAHPMASVGTSLYEVVSWCPDEEARVPAEQVHLLFPVRVPIAHIAYMLKNVVGTESPDDSYSEFLPVLRLKSRRACEELLKTITFHMNDVFPGSGVPRGEVCGRVDPAGDDCAMMKPCPLHDPDAVLRQRDA